MQKTWIYFPLEFFLSNQKKGKAGWANFVKIRMMRNWLLACNFILCIKWQTWFHTVRNPLRPWTHALHRHPTGAHGDGEHGGVHPPWLAPERGKSAYTQNTSAHLKADIVLPPPTAPKSDICHSQSAQIATHLCGAVLVPQHRELQREKDRAEDWARRAQGGQSQKKRDESMEEAGEAAAGGYNPFLVNWCFGNNTICASAKSLMHKVKRCHCFWIHSPAAKVNNSTAPGFFQHKDPIGPQLHKQVLHSFECLGSLNPVLE